MYLTFAAFWQMFTSGFIFVMSGKKASFPFRTWGSKMWAQSGAVMTEAVDSGSPRSKNTKVEVELRNKNNFESIVVISGFFNFCTLFTWAHKFTYLPILFWVFFFYLHLVLSNIYKLSPLILSNILYVHCKHQDQKS